MNAKVKDLMISQVMTATPHQTFGHVKSVLSSNRGSCLPVVNSDGEPVGMVTASDLLDDHSDNTPISTFMTEKIYTVPEYGDVSLAARIMRNHKIHHVVVTDKQKVVGIISSFDLLQLVEDKRFVMKNAPDVSQKKKGGKRRKEEVIGETMD
ncbi:MAG: CBS domain-containing protein [Pirellulaceae bacterium]